MEIGMNGVHGQNVPLLVMRGLRRGIVYVTSPCLVDCPV